MCDLRLSDRKDQGEQREVESVPNKTMKYLMPQLLNLASLTKKIKQLYAIIVGLDPTYASGYERQQGRHKTSKVDKTSTLEYY
jgi:hypothetical protein